MRVRHRNRLLAAFVTALLAPAGARADIPPPSSTVSTPIVPRGHERRPERRGSVSLLPRLPVTDAPVDVAMASAAVVIEVYPTLVYVKARFVLRAGDRGEKGIQVGLPFRADGLVAQPLESLAVSVDGRTVVPKHDDGLPADMPTRARLMVQGDDFWLWTMDFPPRSETQVDVSYGQLMQVDTVDGDTFLGEAGYLSRSAAVWRGPLEKVSITVRLRGSLTPADVVLLTPELVATAPTEWVWHAESVEPSQINVMRIRLPAARIAAEQVATAPYSVDGLPGRLQLLDRIVRFTRGDVPTPDALAQLIEELRVAASDDADPPRRDGARSALAELAAQNRCIEWNGVEVPPPVGPVLSGVRGLANGDYPLALEEVCREQESRTTWRRRLLAGAGALVAVLGVLAANALRKRRH